MFGSRRPDDRRRALPAAPIDGRSLLRLSRDSSPQALDRLRDAGPEQLAEALQQLAPSRRAEVLELAERPDEIVPLLPPAEFAATVRGAGLEEYGWLVRFATSEQRIAAVDLDCWKDFRFSPSRLLEWLDAIIAAGPETLAAAFDELDPELWVLALKAMGVFAASPDPGGDGEDASSSHDGLLHYTAHSDADEARIRAILGTALEISPSHYWWLVGVALDDPDGEAALQAARWRQGRLADLGFPDPDRAVEVYRPLQADRATFAAAPTGADPAPDPGSRRPVPAPLAGRPLGRALAQLPEARRGDLLRDLFAVANSLAVADRLPLAERESVDRSVDKAVRGVERGLEQTARVRGRSPAVVLDAVALEQLFRVGVTLEPDLHPQRTLADLEREEAARQDGARGDWNRVEEMIAEADRTLGPNGRPR